MIFVWLDDRINPYTSRQSKIQLGKALKSHRDRVIIATKVGFRTGEALTDTGLSSRHIIASAQASL